jgi:hypothetical protein
MINIEQTGEWTVYSVYVRGNEYDVIATTWNESGPRQETRTRVGTYLTFDLAESAARFNQRSYDKVRDVAMESPDE